jgi:maltose alpha-D-glucosyltransferase/alpha-amylase
VPKEGEPSALVLLQAYVANQGDGWAYTLSYLERFIEMRRDAEGHDAYIALMQVLATRTAELHKAFAMKSSDPAFEPEPFTAQDFDAWRARVRQEAEQTLAQLATLERAKALVARREKILGLIDACRPPERPTLKTRHHGDYHLGQVLLANADFVIIDFEGEPTRSLYERRLKRLALRDVAGMLRSFSYASQAALHSQPAPADGAADVAGWARFWTDSVSAAFLGGYLATAGKAAWVPQSADDLELQLTTMLLEKALYELRYELNLRPDWVGIPLRGILDLVVPA